MKTKKAKPVDYSDPLYIGNELAALDTKDREFYDRLTPDQKKKFSTFIMLKWGPSVHGPTDLQTYYLMAFNERVNKNFFDLSKHPKLQWLSITACSPAMGKQKHYWVTASNKKENSALEKQLAKMLPYEKLEHIRMMLKLNTQEQIMAWLEENGIAEDEVNKLYER